MNIQAIFDLFEKHAGEHGEFDRVESPLHRRPDLAGMLLLCDIVPGKARDMVIAAKDHEIFMDVSLDDFVKAEPSESDIITLIRCGVRMTDDGFSMFV